MPRISNWKELALDGLKLMSLHIPLFLLSFGLGDILEGINVFLGAVGYILISLSVPGISTIFVLEEPFSVGKVSEFLSSKEYMFGLLMYIPLSFGISLLSVVSTMTILGLALLIPYGMTVVPSFWGYIYYKFNSSE